MVPPEKRLDRLSDGSNVGLFPCAAGLQGNEHAFLLVRFEAALKAVWPACHSPMADSLAQALWDSAIHRRFLNVEVDFADVDARQDIWEFLDSPADCLSGTDLT